MTEYYKKDEKYAEHKTAPSCFQASPDYPQPSSSTASDMQKPRTV